jgi:hypothetical protein
MRSEFSFGFRFTDVQFICLIPLSRSFLHVTLRRRRYHHYHHHLLFLLLLLLLHLSPILALPIFFFVIFLSSVLLFLFINPFLFFFLFSFLVFSYLHTIPKCRPFQLPMFHRLKLCPPRFWSSFPTFSSRCSMNYLHSPTPSTHPQHLNILFTILYAVLTFTALFISYISLL